MKKGDLSINNKLRPMPNLSLDTSMVLKNLQSIH